MPLHALRDHGLDERDLALDIGGRRSLAEDDLDAWMRCRIGLGGVLHGGEERHRELGDEADLDGVRRLGGRRRDGHGDSQSRSKSSQFHVHSSLVRSVCS